jgi:multiple sugar transport system substrate-binding protein
MNVLMFCLIQGEEPFTERERFVSDEVAAEALREQQILVSLLRPEFLSRNPIRTYEALVGTDDFAYCPFAFGYSNYSRRGYARRALSFGPPVASAAGGRFRTVLGGTGLAVSARCFHRETACDYIRFVAEPEIQSGLYFESGGQPAHRSAWLSAEVNRRSGDFFERTLGALDQAWLRPRYPGFLHFQDQASTAVFEFQTGKRDLSETIDLLQAIYRTSLSPS